MEKVLLLLGVVVLCAGCTLSFQNISTHGTATDVLDENQTPNNNVSPQIPAPLLGK